MDAIATDLLFLYCDIIRICLAYEADVQRISNGGEKNAKTKLLNLGWLLRKNSERQNDFANVWVYSVDTNPGSLFVPRKEESLLGIVLESRFPTSNSLREDV